MKNEIRILCVEDVPADVVMLNHALRAGGLRFRSKRVDTKTAFLHELEHNPPDVILSDHGLPSFDGFTALAIARNKCPEVPFIFVTNSMGEEMTISTFESGATNYVLKKDLSKLAPAVERALREAEERAALKRKDLLLRESEERYRRLVEFCPDAFFVQSEGQIVFANTTAARLLGEDGVQQFTGKPFKEIVHPDSWPAVEKVFNEVNEEGTSLFWKKIKTGSTQRSYEKGATIAFVEQKFVRRDGSLVEVEVSSSPITFENRQSIQIIARDITARKLAEEALHKSEERYRLLVERSPEAVMVIQSNDEIVFANPAAVKLLGVTDTEGLVGKSAGKIFSPDPWESIVNRIRKLRSGHPFTPFKEQHLLRADGTLAEAEVAAAPTIFQGKPAVQVIIHDIGERKQSLEKLRQSEAMKALILESALDAIMSIDHEGRIQEWNPAAEKIFGYRRAEAIGQSMDKLIIPRAMWEVLAGGAPRGVPLRSGAPAGAAGPR